MQRALHAVERGVGLLWHSASNVSKPAVDECVRAGCTQDLTPLCNSAHGLQDGQQRRVLIHRLCQGTGAGVWYPCRYTHTHTQTSEDDDALWVLLYGTTP